MNRKLIPMFAAAVVAGGVVFSIAPNALAASQPAQLADKPKEDATSSDHEMRRVMAQAADKALGPDGANNALDVVAKSDRDRIDKDLNKSEEKAYQAQADKIRKLWKDKYGQEFDAQGHVNDLKGINPDVSGTGTDQTAVIKFPAEPDLPAYELHLIREKSGYWRIQLPDTVTGKTYYKNLMDAIARVDKEKAKLPADENKAYERAVTWVLHGLSFPSK